MNSPLPHFGVVADAILDCIPLTEAGGGLSNVAGVLSERTVRSISSGHPVKQKTWDDQAAALADGLLDSKMFPLQQEDRQHLIKIFHGYRDSYEQLKEMLSRIQAPPKTVQRGLLRLVFFDMAVRYCSMCIRDRRPPPGTMPLWIQGDAGNQFWKQALEERFPNLPLLESKEKDGDCVSRLKMNPSKMRRCLYENNFPGARVLREVFQQDSAKVAAAHRFYAAFALCRKLRETFDQKDVESWVANLLRIAGWLYRLLEPVMAQFPDEKREVLLKRMLFGGAGDKMIQGFLKNKVPDRIPPGFRGDLLAIADNDPVAAIEEYVEFCNYYADCPPPGSWDDAFDYYRADREYFQINGAFPEGTNPSRKLCLLRALEAAQAAGDPAGEEHVLRCLLELDPVYAETHQMLAQLLENMGRISEAWQEFEIAAALDEKFVLPLFSLADSKSRVGHHDDALRIVDRIPPAGVGAGSHAYITGVCLLRAGKLPDAIACLQDAFKQEWKPGTSAALLSWAFHQLQLVGCDTKKEAREWEKQAHHHGIKVEEVSKRLCLVPTQN